MTILSANKSLLETISSNELEGFLTFCDNGMCRLQDKDDHDSLEYFDAEQF
jgi:hypothetical protein